MSTFPGPRGFAGITSDGYQQRSVIVGSGTPEGVVAADIGAIYKDSAAATIYHKLTGFGTNTGWSSASTGGAISGTTGTFSGVILGADGTAAAPGYAFGSAGSADNGMYLAGANSVALATAGAVALTISSAQLVTLAAGLTIAAASAFKFGNRSQLTSTSNGVINAFATDGTTPSTLNVGPLGATTITGTTISGTGQVTTSTSAGAYNVLSVEGNITCSGATSSATTLLPAGATMVGFSSRVTTLVTSGDGSVAFTLGDGTTADLYGTALPFTLAAVTGSAQYKTPLIPLAPASRTITATATGGTFSGGVIKCVVWYTTTTGPTS